MYIHQCIVSCNAYVCVLVCARSVLGSVLRFTVFVQQAIAEITLEVLFEIRRHQHIGTSTNLHENDITNTSLFLVLFNYSLIFFSFSLVTYVFVHCSAVFFLPVLPLLSYLCCSPSLLCPLHLSLPPSLPHTTQLLPGCIIPLQRGPTAAVTGHFSCRTGGSQAGIPHHCKVCGHGQPCQALTNLPCCKDFHQ